MLRRAALGSRFPAAYPPKVGQQRKEPIGRVFAMGGCRGHGTGGRHKEAAFDGIERDTP
jgi:hypothetical protein